MRLVDLHKRSIKAEIPQDNLLAEYKLEETSGTVVLDSKGNYNGSTNSDASLLTDSGIVGNQYNFNGYGPAVIPYNSDFDIVSEGVNKKFSISLWITNANVTSSLRDYIAFANSEAVSGVNWRLYTGQNITKFIIGQTNGTFLSLEFLTSSVEPSAINASANSGPYHVVISVDPTKPIAEIIKGRVNGNLNPNPTTGTLGTFNNGNRPFGFGGRPWQPTASYGTCLVDEVKIYMDKALTSEEAVSIFNKESL